MAVRSSTFTTVLAAGALLITACGGTPDTPPDAMRDPLCDEAVDHDDLAWLQQNVFTPSCSNFTVCHKGTATMAARLNLEDGMTHDSLVDVAAEAFPDYDRVVPGDAENSYLMIILGHFPGPLPEAGTMPYNRPLLCVEKRDAIQRWIEAGAQP